MFKLLANKAHQMITNQHVSIYLSVVVCYPPSPFFLLVIWHTFLYQWEREKDVIRSHIFSFVVKIQAKNVYLIYRIHKKATWNKYYRYTDICRDRQEESIKSNQLIAISVSRVCSEKNDYIFRIKIGSKIFARDFPDMIIISLEWVFFLSLILLGYATNK